MGTYTELAVAGYPLITSKSGVVAEVMTIFRETDRVCSLAAFREADHSFL